MGDDRVCCGACGHAAEVEAGRILEPPSPPLAVDLDPSGLPAAVIVVEHRGDVWRVPFAKRRLTVGRMRTADVAIERDDTLSRLTCAFEVTEEGHVFVEDLKSTCGTYVNGRKVTRSGLHVQDRVRVGNATLYVDIG